MSLEALAWKNFGDKPLFSQMKAAEGGLGARYAHMWDNDIFPSRVEMAGAGWEIVRRDPDERRPGENAYDPVGEKAMAFYQNKEPLIIDGLEVIRPKVAAVRLRQIVSIAQRLPDALSVIRTADDLLKHADTPQDFLHAAESVSHALGIGLTTTFHGLTDMGFRAIKPDIHVARALGRLGTINDARASNAPRNYLGPKLHKAIVVQKAVTFSAALKVDDLLPAFEGNAVREVDIVLMQSSLHGLV
jgi:hypothetical protein